MNTLPETNIAPKNLVSNRNLRESRVVVSMDFPFKMASIFHLLGRGWPGVGRS